MCSPIKDFEKTNVELLLDGVASELMDMNNADISIWDNDAGGILATLMEQKDILVRTIPVYDVAGIIYANSSNKNIIFSHIATNNKPAVGLFCNNSLAEFYSKFEPTTTITDCGVNIGLFATELEKINP